MGNLTAGLLCLWMVIPPLTGNKQEKDPPDPPVRLKKKEKPRALDEPEQKPAARQPRERKDPTGSPSAEEREQSSTEIAARITKNMRASEERLDQKDPGEGTQQIQRDILKDLDALIEQKRREQQQQQSARGSSSSRDERRQQARNQRRMSNQMTQSQAMSRQDQLQPMANRGGGMKDSSERMSKIADLYKEVWGHLPEALRQEMDQYAREKFMAKYGDLLKQYYTTIAEKGHRKGE
jgi:hypothetical protein